MKMIEGIEIKDLIKHIDERGFFSELLREDWDDILHNDAIVQFNLSFSYPNIVRAWHRHLRGQMDYFICLEGASRSARTMTKRTPIPVARLMR